MNPRLERLLMLYQLGRIPMLKYQRLRDYPWLFVVRLNSEAHVFMPTYRWSPEDYRLDTLFRAWCLHPRDPRIVQELRRLARQHGLEVYVLGRYVFAPREQAHRLERLLRQHGWEITDQLNDFEC